MKIFKCYVERKSQKRKVIFSFCKIRAAAHAGENGRAGARKARIHAGFAAWQEKPGVLCTREASFANCKINDD
ncbi:MAG: hypothetical protein IJ083_15150 [Clostridia bacterium]|nr:hypothetical protein [Clostridia bacterium]